MSKPYIVVSCPIDTYSGYGSRARDVVRALMRSDKYDVKILSQKWGNTPNGFLNENNPEEKKMKDAIIQPQLQRQPDVWIQISIPDEFQKLGKFNIGITAGIETDLCDVRFIQGANRMDLILGSSNHSLYALKNSQYEQKDKAGQVVGIIKLETPTDILFEGVDLEKYFHIEPKDLPKTELVKSLDTIDEKFCFLYVGHWLRGAIGEDRKNTGLLVKTFLETFKNKKTAPALILKTMTGPASIMDREAILKKIDAIRKGVNGRLPNIYLLHGDIEDSDVNHLYNHPKVKAMINLTKGEGFGRPLLEFTRSKKPIIASNWSGHLDFLNAEFASLVPGEIKPVHESVIQDRLILKESKWFSPDVSFVSLLMKDYVNGYKAYEVKGKRLARYCMENFSFEKMQEKIEAIMDKNAPKKVEIKLPNIKKISLPKKDD
jgi:glycosyltransferase involved in cell wall biosynthesis